MFDLKFQDKGQGHNIGTWFFEFRDIDLVRIGIKNKFLRYILPGISYWMRYVMFDLEFQGQRSRSQPGDLFFEFPDIHLVGIDTKNTFLLHRHQEILNNV